MRAAITGLGLWLPETVRTNDDWPEDFTARAQDTAKALAEMPEISGDRIEQICARHQAAELGDPFLGAVERRVVSPELRAYDTEAEAARRALADAELDPAELDVVLSWSIVPDRISPPSAAKLTHVLGAKRAWAMGVDSACASAMVQLSLGSAMIESGRARHVLLTQSNLMTRVFAMGHPASPGIGDAATAIVLSASERPGVLGVHAVTHGEHYESLAYIRGGDDETDTPWHEPGGPFFLGSRNREGMKELMANTVRFGHDTIAEACRRTSTRPSDLDVIACTQPRGWIPAAVAESLSLPADRAPTTFTRYAHLGASAALANLVDARDRGALRPGSLVAIYSQGAGFTRAAAIVRWQPDAA